MNDGYLKNAAKGNRMYYYRIVGESSDVAEYVKETGTRYWDYYRNRGWINNSILGLLSKENSDERTKVRAKINDKMGVEIPKFINGTYDLNGADWDTYCKTINKMGHQKITGYLQELYDSFK